jgi:hypothetical protein
MAGNATLVTKDANGNDSFSDIWIQSLQFSSDVEFDDNQVRKGISYRPIRRSEQSLNFTAVWSLQRWDEMDAFQEKIRIHHQLIVSGDATPMQLWYPGPKNEPNFLIFEGWIEHAQKLFVRFENVFVRNYNMNILLQSTNGSALDSGYSGFTPADQTANASVADLFGPGWFNITVGDNNNTKVPVPKHVYVSDPNWPNSEVPPKPRKLK